MIESAVPIPISWDNAKSGDFLLIVSIGKEDDNQEDYTYRYYDTLLVLNREKEILQQITSVLIKRKDDERKCSIEELIYPEEVLEGSKKTKLTYDGPEDDYFWVGSMESLGQSRFHEVMEAAEKMYTEARVSYQTRHNQSDTEEILRRNLESFDKGEFVQQLNRAREYARQRV
jgi:hypothetical protein